MMAICLFMFTQLQGARAVLKKQKEHKKFDRMYRGPDDNRPVTEVERQKWLENQALFAKSYYEHYMENKDDWENVPIKR
jgi:hypothetical protein